MFEFIVTVVEIMGGAMRKYLVEADTAKEAIQDTLHWVGNGWMAMDARRAEE